MPHSVELAVAADHPTAAGHFPGNPVIPGASLLSEVLRAIESSDGQTHDGCEIASAKFLQPVRPGDTIIIAWEITATGSIKFDCRLAATNVPVLNGTLRWTGAPS